jgi:hypothetical protein
MSSKRWVFTLNNYTDNDEVAVQAIECLYLVYGREVSHLQGFVTFKTMQRLSGVKKLLPTAHWEIAKGSSCQASDYCKKDGNFFEKGKIDMNRHEGGLCRDEHRDRHIGRHGAISEDAIDASG